MAPRRPGVLDPLRQRVRRLQLVVVIGFAAFVVGSILSVALLRAIGPVVAGAPAPVVVLLHTALTRLWLLVILPLVWWALARIIPVRPWSTAIGSAASGEVFLLALDFVSGGVGAWFRGVLPLVLQVATLGLGIWLTGRTIALARVSADRAQAQAQARAAAREAEYRAFAEASAAVADQVAAREGEKPTPPS